MSSSTAVSPPNAINNGPGRFVLDLANETDIEPLLRQAAGNFNPPPAAAIKPDRSRASKVDHYQSDHRNDPSSIVTHLNEGRGSSFTSLYQLLHHDGRLEAHGALAGHSAFAHRPAFNTNQQHYSPAKSLAPKPLTSSYLAPPSPSKLPTNVAISAETSRLQTELLQLSLLHRDAAAVDAEWRESARVKLGARFDRAAVEDAALAQAERAGVEAHNVGALIRWGQDGGGQGLEGKVQALGQVLDGVWALSSDGARYQRVVRGFEAWAARAADILAAQRAGDAAALLGGDNDDAVLFLSELDRDWTHDCAGLARKLDAWRRTLRELGGAEEQPESEPELQQPPSGLARVLSGCRHLVEDMCAELALMEQIEADAARAELEWIERMNRELQEVETPGRREDVPLWKLAA
ncbi:hypothetical protein GGR56DRAFT_688202 [Xylariaceae sp. FL0804]|nr:hypothetical protein GGR56DRAFT_688202 [Xylariaceae sp. FL0804]